MAASLTSNADKDLYGSWLLSHEAAPIVASLSAGPTKASVLIDQIKSTSFLSTGSAVSLYDAIYNLAGTEALPLGGGPGYKYTLELASGILPTKSGDAKGSAKTLLTQITAPEPRVPKLVFELGRIVATPTSGTATAQATGFLLIVNALDRAAWGVFNAAVEAGAPVQTAGSLPGYSTKGDFIDFGLSVDDLLKAGTAKIDEKSFLLVGREKVEFKTISQAALEEFIVGLVPKEE